MLYLGYRLRCFQAATVKIDGVYAAIQGALYIGLNAIANHDTGLALGIGCFKGILKNTRVRLFAARELRIGYGFKVMCYVGMLQFTLLNFVWAVGNDVKAVFLFELFQYFYCTLKKVAVLGKKQDIVF